MLATQGYEKESVLLMLLLCYEYENIFFKNCYYFTFFPYRVKQNPVLFLPLKEEYK